MTRHIPAGYSPDHAVSYCDCGVGYITRGPGCEDYPACCGQGWCDHCGELFAAADIGDLAGDRACQACRARRAA